MVTIAFFEVEPWEKEHLTAAMHAVERKFVNPVAIRFSEDRLTPENVKDYADADIVSVFIFSKIDKKMLDRLPNLKHINTQSTGYDHIDLAACARRGITVSNVPSYGENTVAEHAFALILAISRKIVPSVEQTRRCDFSTGPALRGFDLMGKTLGVIGTGKIGKHAIRMAKGFGMKVVAFDAYPDAKAAQELGFTYENRLEDVLAKSDVLTLHAPLMPSTKHMVNMKNIASIKRGCVLVNTARGGLVETEALLYALEEGILSAAGLDVLELETEVKEEKALLHKDVVLDYKTLLEEHILGEYENVLITPHNAFNSEEALKRILDTSAENIKDFLSKKPANIVKA